MSKPSDLLSTFVVIQPDQAVIPVEVTPTIFEELDARFEQFRGRWLVSSFAFDASWSTWEMHPAGDEIVCLLSGEAFLVLDRDGIEDVIQLRDPGSFAIGTGRSTKPSEGLKARFPQYNYDDMVQAQYRLVKEHLGIRHLRLVLGNSMGGMQTWMWGEKYPDYMDTLVPMASMPTAMSGRNWMLRRMIIDSVRNDPDWNNGNYTRQPRNLQSTLVYFGIATSGGSQALYAAAPTREKADALLDARLKQPLTGDANDILYQWDSSKDYDPAPGLERIQAAVLVINSADDERNPPELGILDREMKRVRNGHVVMIPATDQTRGHGTTGMAKFWKKDLAAFLQSQPLAAK